MPKRLVYIAVEAYVPPQRPGFPGGPDQGLPGAPDYPDQGLPGEPDYPSQGPGFPGQGLPGWPDYPDQGLPGWPGFPERPGQGLPRPPRPQVPVYPIVEDHELGGHPEADHLDLNQTRRILVTDGQDQYTAYALEPYPPEVEDDYEPRHPTKGLPGTWVAVLYRDSLVWAWVRTPGAPGEPGHLPSLPGEREPKFG